jgi:hypothetical protein
MSIFFINDEHLVQLGFNIQRIKSFIRYTEFEAMFPNIPVKILYPNISSSNSKCWSHRFCQVSRSVVSINAGSSLPYGAFVCHRRSNQCMERQHGALEKPSRPPHAHLPPSHMRQQWCCRQYLGMDQGSERFDVLDQIQRSRSLRPMPPFPMVAFHILLVVMVHMVQVCFYQESRWYENLE